MTYAELIADIKLLAKRSDIDDKIAIALRMTTLRAHRLDYFWRDLVEVDLSFAPSQEVMIDLATDLVRFRQMNFVRYYDPTTGALGNFLEPIAPMEMLDSYSWLLENKYYLAGTNIHIRFAWSTSGARLGYWQSPDVTPGSYNSWIADELPDILIQGSLAYIFNFTGKQEEARALNRMCGFEVDPANRAPGMTLADQLRGIALMPEAHA